MQQKRIAIYARVSTEEQANHGFSIDAQLHTLTEFATLQGAVVVEQFVDRGISGKSMKGRLELQRLLEQAKQNAFDEVIVWKINRMARNVADLLKIIDMLTANKVTFRSYSENFETETPMGRFSLQMMGAIGELERNTIVENVRMGMKQRAREGQWNGGIVLGYESVDNQLQVVESEANIVRSIFHQYTTGKGYKAIADQLNKLGYKTKKGNQFSFDAVKMILTNPIYVGNIRFNRYENWGEMRRKGKSDSMIEVKGSHQAIITEDVWQQVQTVRKTKRYGTKKKGHNCKYMLTGILKCPVCNSPMATAKNVKTLKCGLKKTTRYYVCGQYKNKGASVCKSNSVRADIVEPQLIKAISHAINYSVTIDDIVAQLNSRNGVAHSEKQQQLNQINCEIQKCKDNIGKYLDMLANTGNVAIVQKQVTERLEVLNQKIVQLEEEKSKLADQILTDKKTDYTHEEIKAYLEKIDEVIAKAKPEDIKLLMNLMIKDITIKDKAIDTIVINIPQASATQAVEVDAFLLWSKSEDSFTIRMHN